MPLGEDRCLDIRVRQTGLLQVDERDDVSRCRLRIGEAGSLASELHQSFNIVFRGRDIGCRCKTRIGTGNELRTIVVGPKAIGDQSNVGVAF